jgi:chemotaxis protein methyltransferase CheR
MTKDLLAHVELSSAQFERARKLAYEVSGIRLDDTKVGLVTARIMHRLRALSLPNMGAYFELLDKDPAESAKLVDELTTNKTSFFRESSHFDVLRKKGIATTVNRRLRVWSAGCSSGEEPYTLAMTLREMGDELNGYDVRILATDLSERMLSKARAGIYDDEQMGDIAPALRAKYFERTNDDQWRVKPVLRQLIQFAPLNLQGEWPMKGPFNAIYCRNVMIYFDRETRQKLVNRFTNLLAPNGFFFVGHSESLTGLTSTLRYVEPAAYARP